MAPLLAVAGYRARAHSCGIWRPYSPLPGIAPVPIVAGYSAHTRLLLPVLYGVTASLPLRTPQHRPKPNLLFYLSTPPLLAPPLTPSPPSPPRRSTPSGGSSRTLRRGDRRLAAAAASPREGDARLAPPFHSARCSAIRGASSAAKLRSMSRRPSRRPSAWRRSARARLLPRCRGYHL
jgi:hypothetical protein